MLGTIADWSAERMLVMTWATRMTKGVNIWIVTRRCHQDLVAGPGVTSEFDRTGGFHRFHRHPSPSERNCCCPSRSCKSRGSR